MMNAPVSCFQLKSSLRASPPCPDEGVHPEQRSGDSDCAAAFRPGLRLRCCRSRCVLSFRGTRSVAWWLKMKYNVKCQRSLDPGIFIKYLNIMEMVNYFYIFFTTCSLVFPFYNSTLYFLFTTNIWFFAPIHFIDTCIYFTDNHDIIILYYFIWNNM